MCVYQNPILVGIFIALSTVVSVKNRTEKDRTGRDGTEQNRAEQNRRGEGQSVQVQVRECRNEDRRRNYILNDDLIL